MDRFSLFEPLYRHAALRKSRSEGIVTWAVDLLAGNTDTPSLRILAGLAGDASEHEVLEYFTATVAELGEVVPSENEQSLGGVRAVASAIVQGEVSPMEGVAQIHTMAVGPLNHPAFLQPWCDLDSGFRSRPDSPRVEMLEGKALDVAIISYATDFLSGQPLVQLRLLEADLEPGSIA